jgi:hypothetical protein
MKVFTVFTTWCRLHRRFVAAVLAMICVGSICVIATGRDGSMEQVVVTQQRVLSGQTVDTADLGTQLVPREFIPEGALTSVDEATGQMLAATLPAGSMVTTDAFVSARDAIADGQVVMPIRLAQPEFMSLISPGCRIALFIPDLTTGQNIIEHDVLVVAVPASGDSGGLLSSGSSANHILVSVTEDTASRISAVAASTELTAALDH